MNSASLSGLLFGRAAARWNTASKRPPIERSNASDARFEQVEWAPRHALDPRRPAIADETCDRPAIPKQRSRQGGADEPVRARHKRAHQAAPPRFAMSSMGTMIARNARMRHEGAYGKVVVHGHTPVQKPDLRANRINIDTGAYMSSVLSAVVLENESRRILSTGQALTASRPARAPEAFPHR